MLSCNLQHHQAFYRKLADFYSMLWLDVLNRTERQIRCKRFLAMIYLPVNFGLRFSENAKIASL